MRNFIPVFPGMEKSLSRGNTSPSSGLWHDARMRPPGEGGGNGAGDAQADRYLIGRAHTDGENGECAETTKQDSETKLLLIVSLCLPNNINKVSLNIFCSHAEIIISP